MIYILINGKYFYFLTFLYGNFIEKHLIGETNIKNNFIENNNFSFNFEIFALEK
jgi:hypothetical protein